MQQQQQQRMWTPGPCLWPLQRGGMQQVQQLGRQVSGADQPDPLVQLKQQELQIKAQAEQADAQVDMAKLNLDAQNQQMRSNQFQQRLASQEKVAAARINSAMEREILKQTQR